MKYYTALFLVLWGLCATAQENYSAIIAKAQKENNQDSTHYETAFKLYEKAFNTYPDSITHNDQYWASTLAAYLHENDKAFKYLIPLASLEKDDFGDPGWDYILGYYAEEDYKNLFNDSRWEVLKQQAIKDKKKFFEQLKSRETEFYKVASNDYANIKNTEKLYKELQESNPYIIKEQRDYSIAFPINDTLKTSFLVHLPENYNPKKKYALLFFLHGAVRSNILLDYQIADWNLGGFNRYYTKYAAQNDVILVFPRGNKDYNWMAPDDGFFMIPEMLKLIKKAINIDDNKVFISGHSNGATGSFSYLMKQPTPFAGFYGFNTYPKVFTGGTFVENIKNRSFINFSTDEDYYYPPNANDDFTKLMNEINADYKDYRYNGFPHWFPQFDESEPAHQILFADLIKRQRNPFPKEISWEFDDEKYGTIDWLSNIKLDTLSSKSTWHKELNFKINKWLRYDKNDSLIAEKVDKNAFDFPRKSGKIKATYDNNVFKIKTSAIKSFSIIISPEMVKLKKKVKVYLND